MNWLKNNLFLTVLGALTLVGCIGAGVFLAGAKSKLDTVSADYETEARELVRLQRIEPFPSADNVEKIRENVNAFQGLSDGMRETLASTRLNITVPAPNEFQQKLLASVNDTVQTAKKQNVGLPEDFFLGFADYQAALPLNDAVKGLSIQLAGISEIVDLLIANNITRINALARDSVPGETAARPTPTPSDARPAPGNQAPNKNTSSAVPPFTSYGIDLSFTCQHNTFQLILNEITKMKQFFIVRAVKVVNERQEGPLRGVAPTPAPETFSQPGVTDMFNPASAPTPDPATGEIPVATEATAASSMDFVLGREKIDVVMRIDFVQFANVTEINAKPSSPGGTE